MRVLELGSGAGDMSFVVADIVGPAGEVVGIESASEAPAVPSTSTMRWPCHVNVVKITR